MTTENSSAKDIILAEPIEIEGVPPKVIGITGLARSGKDTFCHYALEFLAKKKVTCTRKSFADRLKADLNQICVKQLGFSSFTENTEEKALIRPLLVAYGTDVMRKINERWWINKLEEDLKICATLNALPIITDIRYENEMEWLRGKLGGVCVHITKEGVVPPNKQEAQRDPLLKKASDYTLSWPHYGMDDIKKCRPRVTKLMKRIHSDYICP